MLQCRHVYHIIHHRYLSAESVFLSKGCVSTCSILVEQLTSWETRFVHLYFYLGQSDFYENKSSSFCVNVFKIILEARTVPCERVRRGKWPPYLFLSPNCNADIRYSWYQYYCVSILVIFWLLWTGMSLNARRIPSFDIIKKSLEMTSCKSKHRPEPFRISV